MTYRMLTGGFIESGARLGATMLLAVSLLTLPSLSAIAETLVIYGATGNIGGRITTEALSRGHMVIGVSRDPASVTLEHPNLTATGGDVTNLDSMLEVITGADAVLISVNGNGADNTPENAITNLAALTFIQAAGRLGEASPRGIQVGGGTTLRRNGVLGLESGGGEEGTPRHGRIWGHWVALENYRASTGVPWTVVSPPPGALPGDVEGTGRYRLGEDDVLFNNQGESGISLADLAAAIIDEVENPQSIGKRITLGPLDR